jgi:hypothetical protein
MIDIYNSYDTIFIILAFAIGSTFIAARRGLYERDKNVKMMDKHKKYYAYAYIYFAIFIGLFFYSIQN